MDLVIYESGDGGDLVLNGSDLSTTNGLFNYIYLALFGGNVEQSTPIERDDADQAFDWWGNSILFGDNTAIQMNSLTEKALRENTNTSAGRVKLEQIVKRDLEFMSQFAEISVNVTLESIDRIKIAIQVNQPNIESIKEFIFIWSATKQELIVEGEFGSLGTQTISFIDFDENDFDENDFL